MAVLRWIVPSTRHGAVMPTFCADCDNVHSESRKRLPHYWLCTKFRRLEGMGFVAPAVWVEQEPYMRCVGINGGACCVFTPRRDGEQK